MMSDLFKVLILTDFMLRGFVLIQYFNLTMHDDILRLAIMAHMLTLGYLSMVCPRMALSGLLARLNERWNKMMLSRLIIDTESFRDLQENFRAYNFVSELEFRAVGVLSRSYNQGTYGRCAGMARRPLTV